MGITELLIILFSTSSFVTVRALYNPRPWLEFGYVTVAFEYWTKTANSISTTFKNPRFFMSLPITGNEEYSSGYQVCTRIKDIKQSRDRWSFKVKLVQPNDTWCNYTWWTPQIVEPIRMSYLILEGGHYTVEAAEFDIGQRDYDHHCQYDYRRWNWKRRFFDGNVKPALLMQHQSFNDFRFISYRINPDNINANGVTFYLQLHNFDSKWRPRLGDCRPGEYRSYYDNNRWRQAYTVAEEEVAFFGYSPNYAATCIEGIAFETHRIFGVTSETRYLPYYWAYEATSFTAFDGTQRVRYPGVFGMVNSFGGGDEVTVRAFNQSITGSGRTFGLSIALQESQCDKLSILHLNAEVMGFFVVGFEPTYVNGEPNFNKDSWSQQELTVIPRRYCDAIGWNYTEAPTGQPSVQPSGQPSTQPSGQPSTRPTAQPSSQPSDQPSAQPSGQPTSQPSSEPSAQPSSQPSGQPTVDPSAQPSGQPSGSPSSQPSAQPTTHPTSQPSSQPSGEPSGQPSGQPTNAPSSKPTPTPTVTPTVSPTVRPSAIPNTDPTFDPTLEPTVTPSVRPTSSPTVTPTTPPTGQPSMQPTGQPSMQPTTQPSVQPSAQPTVQPSGQPSLQPTVQPTSQPSGQPSAQPTSQPSSHPSAQPSGQPSVQPSSEPSAQPTAQPSGQPSGRPSAQPSSQPTSEPSAQPSGEPSAQPSAQPTSRPSAQPSGQPSAQPTARPTRSPTLEPTLSPTVLARCPWRIPTEERRLIGNGNDNMSIQSGCREGNDLAILSDLTIGDCQNYCLAQAIVDSSFSNMVCTLIFNIFTHTHTAASQSECEKAAVQAADATCDSVQFTSYKDDLKGVCTLKTTRRGPLVECESPLTTTYDFVCESKESSF